MASYNLRGRVTGHDGQVYTVGESTNNGDRHSQNVRHYANPINFAAWKIEETIFGENGSVVTITEFSNN